MKQEIDFLKPNVSIIRKSIRGIDDSYNNFWDILAELLQNSIDAINKRDDRKGLIKLKIDCISKEISIYDNGIGMKNENIPHLLCPFSTDKENDFESIGEKGVGLKFVIFQSNLFTLKTSYISNNLISNITIKNAAQWKNSITDETLKLESSTQEGHFDGTQITVKGIENDTLFNLSFNSMKFILRTKTAVGNVLTIFDKEPNVNIQFEMIDNNGKSFCETLNYKYWLPTECMKSSELCNLDDFEEWLKKDRTDKEKRNYLKDKIIYKKGLIKHNGNRELKYWACFVSKRDVWNKISIRENLLSSDIVDNEDRMQENFFNIHKPGIYTSVKGMPTGISIDAPSTGYAGYWANIFILFEDSSLKFDIGRKSINGNIKLIYQKYAKDIFKDFTSYVIKYIAGEPNLSANPSWDREDTKFTIDSMAKLNSNIVNFKNIPADYNASVAAIFYELIGANKITNLIPVITGYKDKYDLYAYWENHFAVIEFKAHLKSIIKDFDNLEKCSNEIDYIVCWDVNDQDVIAFNNLGIDLTEITYSPFSDAPVNHIPLATHTLSIPGANSIYIIDLKKVLKDLEEGV